MKKYCYLLCVIALLCTACQSKQDKSAKDAEPATPAVQQETVILDGVYPYNFNGFELWTLQDMQKKLSADLFMDA